jgi:hypothetical protein
MMPALWALIGAFMLLAGNTDPANNNNPLTLGNFLVALCGGIVGVLVGLFVEWLVKEVK